MKKTLKSLFLAFVLVFGVFAFAACGKDKATHVSSLAELKTAVEKGGNITLDKDITEVNEMIYVKKDTTLNLNGKKVSGNLSGEDNQVMFYVVGAKLSVKGNGTIEGNDCYIFATADKDTNMAELTIEDGSFKATDSSTVVHAYTGMVNIKGGSFENTSSTYGTKYLINKQDDKAETTKIVITGGNFKGFNPASNTADGKNTNYVAEGYKSTEKDGVWTVTKN